MSKQYKIDPGGVRRFDGHTVPECADNSDWKEYLKWLDAGNTPDPMDVLPELTYKELRKKAILDVWSVTDQLEAITESWMNYPEKKYQLIQHITNIKLMYPKEV